jgi:predicted SAM-dependent methyltransferase
MSLLSRSVLKLRNLALPNTIQGHLGALEGRLVSGWAFDPANPSAEVQVSIRADGVLLGTAAANQFREDLKAAGIGLGHGKYAFGFHVPPDFRPTASFQLSAEVDGRNRLAASPLTVDRLPDDSVSGHLDGCNDGVVFGWALIQQNPQELVSVAIEHEGRLLGSVKANAFREDLRLSGVGSGRGQHGFRLPVPPEVRALKTYTLTARVEGGPYEGGPSLEGSPMTVTENTDQPFQTTGSAVRSFLAGQYFQGQGLEIGALNHPMRLPAGCSVRYADAFTSEELRKQYPVELQGYDIVEVDIITDAHLLTGVDDSSQNFVIANHVLEHLEDPLLALRNMLRVLLPGGVLFLALPDKRHTFDRDRPCTTFEHILEDHRNGPESSRAAHHLEWLRVVEKVPESEIEDRLRVLTEEPDSGIHLHVWSQFEVLNMLDRARGVVAVNYELECFKANGAECISVLRRLPD